MRDLNMLSRSVSSHLHHNLFGPIVHEEELLDGQAWKEDEDHGGEINGDQEVVVWDWSKVDILGGGASDYFLSRAL